MKELNILFIDDDSLVRVFFDYLGKYFPHKFTTMDNAVSALSLLETKDFNLIFTDFHMPKMTGGEFIKEYYEKYFMNDSDLTKPPIVLVTGYSNLADDYNIINYGQEILNKKNIPLKFKKILKPFSLAQIDMAIREYADFV